MSQRQSILKSNKKVSRVLPLITILECSRSLARAGMNIRYYASRLLIVAKLGLCSAVFKIVTNAYCTLVLPSDSPTQIELIGTFSKKTDSRPGLRRHTLQIATTAEVLKFSFLEPPE